MKPALITLIILIISIQNIYTQNYEQEQDMRDYCRSDNDYFRYFTLDNGYAGHKLIMLMHALSEIVLFNEPYYLVQKEEENKRIAKIYRSVNIGNIMHIDFKFESTFTLLEADMYEDFTSLSTDISVSVNENTINYQEHNNQQVDINSNFSFQTTRKITLNKEIVHYLMDSAGNIHSFHNSQNLDSAYETVIEFLHEYGFNIIYSNNPLKCATLCLEISLVNLVISLSLMKNDDD